MGIKICYLVLPALFPPMVFAQMENGAGVQYGFGWWLWTVILLVIVALIVWWAVRTGSRSGPSSRLPGGKSRGDMAGGRTQ